MSDHEELEAAIAAQEGLRGTVPDAVIEVAVAALRDQLRQHATERRRQITVLFADVSGFTAMSSDLDAEVVAGSMNRLWSRLDAVIAEHGGRVDKHIGDAVMAVWGTTSTQEDDPERAVRAGLALQAALRADDGDLSVRVGINTGLAHLGAVGSTNEFTAMGDTVNVASRAQDVAPRGGVLITHDTYRHILGIFDVRKLEPVHVKGKTDPLRVYVVDRAKERAFRKSSRGVEGVETQTIGRSAELAVLQQEFEAMTGGAGTRLVTVVGEAGVGKSRLLYELENWIDLHPATVYFFKGRALADRSFVAFGLARDVVASRLGVLDSDTAAVVAEKLRAGLEPFLTADEAVIVGQWLGFDLGANDSVQRLLGLPQLASTARSHLFRYLDALTQLDPVVVFLEDLHWADDESLRLFDDLVERRPQLRLLVVGVTRAALFERIDEAARVARSTRFVRLGPLDATATRELSRELLQRAPEVPDVLLDLITERSDGNAFFAEELVKMLVEDGVIDTERDGGAWLVHVDRLDPDRVPATLTGVLQTRLDGLAPVQRSVLQRSSVIGRVFWDRAVATLGDEALEPTTEALGALRERELVFAMARSSFDDAGQFAFKHALLRDVAYETVLLRDRQRLHRMAAAWIRAQAGERINELGGLVATHLRLAGEPLAAAEELDRAAAAALESGSASAAKRLLMESFGLRQAEGGSQPAAALLDMTEACLRLGRIDEAEGHALDALERAAPGRELLRARYLASWVASEHADPEREEALLAAALPDAEVEGGILLNLVLTGLALAALNRGDLAAAEALGSRSLGLAERIRHPVALRQALYLSALLATSRGDAEASLRHAEAALAFTTETGDLEGQTLSYSMCGVSQHLIADGSGEESDYRAALEHYERGNALSRQLGLDLRQAMSASNIGQVHLRLGDLVVARVKSLEAMRMAVDAGARAVLLFCVVLEADRRLSTGDPRGALLLGLVRAHPSATTDIHREIATILGRSDLGSEEVERLLHEGASLDLDETVARLIRELEAG